MKNFIAFLFVILLSSSSAFADDINYDSEEQQNPVIQGLTSLKNLEALKKNDNKNHVFQCPVCGAKLLVQQVAPAEKPQKIKESSTYDDTESPLIPESTSYQSPVYYPEKETIIIHDRPDYYHRPHMRHNKKHPQPPFGMMPPQMHKNPQINNKKQKPVGQNQKPAPKPQANNNANKPAGQNPKPASKPQANNNTNKPTEQNQKPAQKPQASKNTVKPVGPSRQHPQQPQTNRNNENKSVKQVQQPSQRPQINRTNVNRPSAQAHQRPQQSQMSRSNISRPSVQNHQRPSQSRPQTQSRPANRSNSQQKNNQGKRH